MKVFPLGFDLSFENSLKGDDRQNSRLDFKVLQNKKSLTSITVSGNSMEIKKLQKRANYSDCHVTWVTV